MEKRYRQRPKSGQEALLEILWNKYGGPAELSRKLGFGEQDFINWRRRGRVPISKIKDVVKLLNVPAMGLNYKQLSSLQDSPPTWEQVVKSYGFSPDEEKRILFFKPPTS